jgi:hypothetical protein
MVASRHTPRRQWSSTRHHLLRPLRRRRRSRCRRRLKRMRFGLGVIGLSMGGAIVGSTVTGKCHRRARASMSLRTGREKERVTAMCRHTGNRDSNRLLKNRSRHSTKQTIDGTDMVWHHTSCEVGNAEQRWAHRGEKRFHIGPWQHPGARMRTSQRTAARSRVAGQEFLQKGNWFPDRGALAVARHAAIFHRKAKSRGKEMRRGSPVF